MKLSRAFSVQTAGSRVSVLAGNATPLHVATKPREQVLRKLDVSLLHESLDETLRRQVFRPSLAHELQESLDPVVAHGRKLKPMDYPGLPSVSDLLDLITTSESLEQLEESKQLFHSYSKYPHVRGNLRPQHFVAYLRKAAAFGVFQGELLYFTSRRQIFGEALTAPVFHEALRLYALITPSVGRNGLRMLKKLHSQAAGSPGKALPYLYGLLQHRDKFPRAVPFLDKVVQAALSEIEQNKDGIDPVDLALGRAAAELLGDEGQALLDNVQPESEESEIIAVTLPQAAA